MSIVIDLTQDEETLVRAAAGEAGIDPTTYIANLIHHHLLQQKAKSGQRHVTNEKAKTLQRVGNLHPGNFRPSDDFDAPLPDDFWLGELRSCSVNRP